MYRIAVLIALLSGLGLTAFTSMRGVHRNASPEVHTLEDGSGWPTPR